MYSYEERMRAVALYIKYGMSIATVIRDLGYPSRAMLYNWYKEFQEKGMISKSHKLNAEIVDAFAETCENVETTQALELEKFMKRYIRKHHPDYE